MPKFCPKCGSKLTEGAAFCDICGAKLSVQPQKSARQPQPVVQPTRYEPVQSAAPQPAPKKKGHGALAAVIIVIAVLLVAGTVTALFFYPGFLKPKSEKNAEPTTQAETTQATTVEETTDEETTAPEATEEETEEETEESFSELAVDYPEPEDFGWFINMTSAPTGAEMLTESEDINGEWKYIVEYYGSSSVIENGIMTIEAGDRAVTVTGDPYKVNYDGEYVESDGKDFELNGSFDTGTIMASGTYGKLTMTQFYKLGSHQYAIGELVNPSGEKAYVGFVRP